MLLRWFLAFTFLSGFVWGLYPGWVLFALLMLLPLREMS